MRTLVGLVPIEARGGYGERRFVAGGIDRAAPKSRGVVGNGEYYTIAAEGAPLDGQAGL